MVKKNFLKSSLIVLAVLAVALIPTASVKASVANRDVPALAYSAHVQSFGWMGTKNASADVNDANTIAGTEGLSKRVEALRVTFEAPAGVVLRYNAHIQGIGWTGWTEITEANQLIGTEGQQKRLEAIKFSVTGLEGYEIKYRAHVQTYGWQDWLTADSSEGLARVAGTQGECKRIESLQFLILDSEAAEVFDLKQEAIQQLKAYANASEFTMNKKALADALEKGIAEIDKKNNTTKTVINAALNTAKGYIDGVLNDRTIKSKVAKVCDEIDNWITTKGLDKSLDGETLKVTLTEVPSIKNAIAAAKAELLNKESYVDTDFTGNILYAEAIDSIKVSLVEYAVEEIENLYNATYKTTDNVYTYENRSTDLTTLKLTIKEDGSIDSVDKENLPGTSAIITLLKELAPDDKKTLQERIDAYTTVLEKTLNKDYNKNIWYKEALQSHGLLDKNVTTFNQISWVAEAIKDGKEDMKNAKNVAQLREIRDNTIDNALTGLIRFVNKLIGNFSKLNSTGKMLTNADKEAIQDVISKEDLTATELIAGLKTMMDTLAPQVKGN